jgi:hypothetical protein
MAVDVHDGLRLDARMILRPFVIALFVGGCALAAAPQDNARLDAAASADSATSHLDSSRPIDASMIVAADAPADAVNDINGTCAHAICSTGSALHATCSSCTDQICSGDSYCCTTKWDSECVGEVSSVCGDTCS